MTFAKPRISVVVAKSSNSAVYGIFIDCYTPAEGALVRVGLGAVPLDRIREHVADLEARLLDEWEPADMLATAHFRDPLGPLQTTPRLAAGAFFE